MNSSGSQTRFKIESERIRLFIFWICLSQGQFVKESGVFWIRKLRRRMSPLYTAILNV